VYNSNFQSEVLKFRKILFQEFSQRYKKSVTNERLPFFLIKLEKMSPLRGLFAGKGYELTII
jgi:hypothetical protein